MARNQTWPWARPYKARPYSSINPTTPAYFRNNYLPNNGISESFEVCRASLQEYRRLVVEENVEKADPLPLSWLIPLSRLRKPTHIYFDENGEMPPFIPQRALEVRKVFELDPIDWRESGNLDIACQLIFEFVPSGTSLKSKDQNTCVDIIYATSGRDYKASSVGWNRKIKLREMRGKDMMYLLIRQGEIITGGKVDTEETVQVKKTTNEMPAPKNPLEQLTCDYLSDSEYEDIVAPSHTRASKRRKISEWPDPSMHGSVRGFISFMFTHDDPPHENREVLYIYEIHLHERLRGGGLGSKLIKFAENAAKECGVSKTMLTVFSNNTGARAVYEKLGYVKDACSPEDKIVRKRVIQADYVIMSKELV
tara:strand:- start:12779 stop:13876 length:1098 start_codon:yes stop_codon:yes gene_type:complete